MATISTITEELVIHGIPRWDVPEEGGTVPERAWWLFAPLEGCRGTLHVCGRAGEREWQLEVGYCLESGEVMDVMAIEEYCGTEIASLLFWPGLRTAVGFALAMTDLWVSECERVADEEEQTP